MADIYCKMYYVGQGALNLIWIIDNDKIPYAAVIDCGSNSDKLDCMANSLAEVNNILRLAGNIDVFITHLDTDHYNFLNELTFKVRNLHVGSWTPDPDSEDSRAVQRRELKAALLPAARELVTYPENYANNQAHTCVGTYTLEYICFMTNFGDEVNDRCAIYGFRTHSYAVIFTGDITGATFNQMNGYIYSAIKNFIGDRQVLATVPHHGSLTTLEKDNFVELKSDMLNLYDSTSPELSPENALDDYYDIMPFTSAIFDLNLSDGIYFASAGIHAGFLHPRQSVMQSLSNQALEINGPGDRIILYGDQYETHPPHWHFITNTSKAIYGSIIHNVGAGGWPTAPMWVRSNQIGNYVHLLAPYSYKALLNDDDNQGLAINAYDQMQRLIYTDRYSTVDSNGRRKVERTYVEPLENVIHWTKTGGSGRDSKS